MLNGFGINHNEEYLRNWKLVLELNVDEEDRWTVSMGQVDR